MKTIIKITKIKPNEEGIRNSDFDAPVLDNLSKKFEGKVKGNYKGGNYESEIEAEIILPPNISKIEIEIKE